MKKKFRLTEQNYRYLFDNASDAMWVHDMDGDILVANKASERLTGYAHEELISINVVKFLTSELLDAAKEVKRKLLEGEDIEQPYEQRLLRKDGTIGIVMMATSLVIIDGQAAGFQNIARDVTEEKKMQENLRFYVQQITRAQEEERKRIARELHDDVSPPLLLLIQRLDSLASRPKPKLSRLLKQNMEDLRNKAIEALGGVRRYAQDLRPRIVDDLGLVASLEWMAEELVKNYGIDAHVEVTGTERSLSSEVGLLLFRIAQEALSNTRRHAGASTVVSKLEFGNNEIKMTVNDNGKGFILPPQVNEFASIGKLGILGMYERAHLLGGNLEIQSEPGKGTQVVAKVPLLGQIRLSGRSEVQDI
ncbi:PAS domain S-box protein [Candidatus Omnitrophota bacterium]